METLVVEKPCIASLLKHFSVLSDSRQSWRVMYPLREVLLLVVCGTIAAGDDYDEIVDWARRIFHSCAASCPFTGACPAPTGCAP